MTTSNSLNHLQHEAAFLQWKVCEAPGNPRDWVAFHTHFHRDRKRAGSVK